MKKKYHVFKINIGIMNIVSIVIFILCVAFTYLLFPNMIKEILVYWGTGVNYIIVLPIMLFYFILHEILHAVGYIIHGAKAKKLTFGVEMEKGVFYCLCKDEITRKNILLSLMYPLFFIGILTYIIGIIFDLPLLILLSICNIVGATGDILYFIFIIRLDKNTKFSEMDDGTSFALISDKDLSKYSHFGLDYVGVVDEIPRKDFKRIKVSKQSWIILIICLIILSILLFIS